jgi:hypothetical protein
MAENTGQSDIDQHQRAQPNEPDADLKSLEPLVGRWKLSGDTTGEVRYEWLEGGFFLLQHVDMELFGHAVKGIEVIGRLRPFGEEPSKEIMSRAYSSTGDTLDYVYELKDNTLMIWGGERGSPAYFQGTFSDDGNNCAGSWVYPDGGYISTMTRVLGK